VDSSVGDDGLRGSSLPMAVKLSSLSLSSVSKGSGLANVVGNLEDLVEEEEEEEEEEDEEEEEALKGLEVGFFFCNWGRDWRHSRRDRRSRRWFRRWW